MMLSDFGASVEGFRKACLALAGAGQRGSLAGQRLGMCWKLTAIKENLIATYHYQLPRSTFRQHLNDCFGWIWKEIKPYRNPTLDQYSRMMIDCFKRGPLPSTTFIVEHLAPQFMGDEEVEIDIVRGSRL